MRMLVQRFYHYPNYSKLIEWIRLVCITGSAQVLIQIIGLVCGILIVRLLPTKEYALYTLANTMLGTMTVLADAGISRGVLAEGGRVWQDRERLGSVLVTGLELRKKFSIVSLIIAIPLLWYLLQRHDTGWLLSLAIVLSLIPAFYSSIHGSLLETGPKLHQDISSLQKVQATGSIGRFLLLVVSLFIFPWAFIAITAAGLSQIWMNHRYRKNSENYTNWDQQPDPIIRNKILKMVKRLLPEALYYCFSGQITIWILSIFGTTESIAQIGALGRLAMALNFFTILFTTLIIPRFARLPNHPGLLMMRHTQVIGIALLINVLIVTLVWMFSPQVLWVLGQDYSSLTNELVLVTINACLGMFYGVCFSLSTSRGWVMHPLILISTNLITIVLGVFLLNIATLQGIITFNIVINIVQILVMLIYNTRKISLVK